MLANSAAGELMSESGLMPQIAVRVGDGKAVIDEYLAEHPEVAALVLGAAAEGDPGPLVTHFSALRRAAALPAVHRARRAERGRDRPVELSSTGRRTVAGGDGLLSALPPPLGCRG